MKQTHFFRNQLKWLPRGILLVLLLSVCRLNADEIPARRIVLKTSDCIEFRRVMLQYTEMSDSAAILRPQLRQRDDQGGFQIPLSPQNTREYFGLRKVIDAGIHPIALTVDLSDAERLTVYGKTDVFHSIRSYYSFDRAAYILDIYWEKPPALSLSGKQGGGPSHTGRAADTPRKSNIEGHQSGLLDLKYHLLKAIIFGTLICLLVVAAVVIIQRRDRKNRAPSGHSKEHTIDTIKQSIQTADPDRIPVADDDTIRELADRGQLSYDEAALLLQSSGKRLDEQA